MSKPVFRITFNQWGLQSCIPITNGKADLSRDWYYWDGFGWIKLRADNQKL